MAGAGPLLPPQGHACSGSTPKSGEPAGREPPEATNDCCQLGLPREEIPLSGETQAGAGPLPLRRGWRQGRLPGRPCRRHLPKVRATPWADSGPQKHHWLVRWCRRTAQPPGWQAAPQGPQVGAVLGTHRLHCFPRGSRFGVGLRTHAEPSVLPRRQAASSCPWSHQHPQEHPALFPGK